MNIMSVGYDNTIKTAKEAKRVNLSVVKGKETQKFKVGDTVHSLDTCPMIFSTAIVKDAWCDNGYWHYIVELPKDANSHALPFSVRQIDIEC